MKRILIATNFSAHSGCTIKYVLNLFKDTQIPCHILLVNTYMVQQTDPLQVILVNDELKSRSKQNLETEKVCALALIDQAAITIETSSHLGTLKNVVQHLLQKDKIDLVAMGKNGGRHVETVANLLKKLKCPLLITYLE